MKEEKIKSIAEEIEGDAWHMSVGFETDAGFNVHKRQVNGALRNAKQDSAEFARALVDKLGLIRLEIGFKRGEW